MMRSCCFSSLSRMAESRERIRILAAPRLLTSSIFKQVYILSEPVRMSFTWSVVTASRPQPKEFNWIRSKSSRVLTKLAAAYSREWYIHWSETMSGRSGAAKWETESSVSTAIS